MGRVVSFIFGCFVLLCLLSCGRSLAKGQGQIPLKEHFVSLSDALEEISSLRTAQPLLGKEKLIEELKMKLSERLKSRGVSKFTAVPPLGDKNRVTDLEVVSLLGNSLTLRWSYKNLGDYDQDGTVGISDIFPLADHFFETASLSNSWIDGDGSGKIDLGDIFPIADNFFTTCAGYKVLGAEPSGDYSEVASVSIGSAQGKEGGLAYFTATLTLGSKRLFKVAPFDKDGILGEHSDPVSVTPQPPIIHSVTPISGASGTKVKFFASVSGTQPLSYSWNFGGGATPNTSTLPAPEVTLGSPDTYNCSLDVSNAYGSASFPFQLTVNEPPAPEEHELWYYMQKNLYVDANVDWAIQLAQTAAQAGYTKCVAADYKFGVIDLYGSDYDQKVMRFLDGARAAGIEVIPSLVPIGYSDAFLQHNPNLIEGQPVVDAEFLVSGGVADVVQDPSTVIVNGDFENHNGDVFPGWEQMDGAGVSTFADTSIFHSGGTSIRFENFTAGNPNGNDRIRQKIRVKPWQCYAVSIWLKTENASPVSQLWFRAFADDPSFEQLTFLTYNISATQDWKRYYLIFNSQDYSSVWLYLGIWGGQSGRFWIDDVSIENTGLINLIRRPGAPLTVKSEDGLTTYTEGLDFEQVVDPKMGHAGSWPGTYDLYHERPVITITPGSRIQEGDKLLVSYYHAVFVYNMQPAVCLSEPETYDIIRNTLTEIEELMHPNAVFIAVDELRVVNWCEACQSRGMTPGELLADTTQRIDQIAHEVNPNWKLLTWSDMYDPYHNAKDNYYLANGTLSGSWDGLPSSWDIGNWRHFGNRAETIEFFASRGHRQILAGFYDENPANFTIDDWLTDAKPYPGVYAVLYTTWREDYSQLSAWAQVVRDWEAQN